MTSRMFSFITGTANPLGGKCPGGCVYCWAQGEKGIAKRYRHEKYKGAARLYEKVLRKRYGSGDFVFVVDMRDLFSPDVPREMILSVLEWLVERPDAEFLLLTKWPERYLEFEGEIPLNVVLGATIESNRDYPLLGRATPQSLRLEAMQDVRLMYPEHRLFVSVEPVLNFDLHPFLDSLFMLKTWKVAVGYDNYRNRLPEPRLEKTEMLIDWLKQFRDVEVKTIRRAWREG